MNISFRQLCGLVFLLFPVGFGACSEVSEQEDRPNIIFIMTDDQAVRTISAYQGGINQTPSIDRLAKEGVLFQNNFVANSICNPSRASILTGKHSHRNGVVGNASPWNNDQTLLPRLLQQAGYTTALVGKWHLNNPPGDEFDYSDRLTGAGKQGFYYNPEFEKGSGEKETLQGHATDLVTQKALRWLSEHSGQQNPFMLFVQFKAPHVPRMPAFRFLDRYENDTIPEPKTLLDDYRRRASYAEQANMRVHYNPVPLKEEHNPEENIYYARMSEDQREQWHRFRDPETQRYRALKREGLLEGDEHLKFAYQKFIKDYLRLIDGVDENVGRLLDWLDTRPEIKKNTVVVYTSDQGFFTGQHGWAEKRFMYEESIQMPLLIRWPGQITPGSRVEALTQNIDFAPTFLEMADLDVPSEMQGRSLLPLLSEKPPADWRQSIYYHYYDHGLHNVPRHDGVRTDRYKLIHFYTDDVWEFYDLSRDPHEVHNRYGDKAYEDRVKKMKAELNRLRNFYGVPPDHFKPPYVKAGPEQEL
ncbi:sulfatase family protein [Fodinibius sediminis]|uniref:Arylsulfatase A n=1 Tax=Fodinibius sediminis TaxID=1214077 RepID=A0A521CVR6_9BACT|nr:sulfatase [Fodinibius sediminis]SMO63518.1 Arylsulfatase A [Fodinibius sediminis]